MSVFAMTMPRALAAPRPVLRGWEDLPEWITTQEAADLSGYTVDYIRKLMRQGRVKGSFRGVMWWVDKDSLKAYLDMVKVLGTKRFHPRGLKAALEQVQD